MIPSDPPEQDTVPVLGATAGVMAALETMEVMKLVIGLGRPCADKLLVFDGHEMRFHEIKMEPSPTCPVCSGLRSRKAA